MCRYTLKRSISIFTMILPHLNATQKGMILALVPVVFQGLFVLLLGCAFYQANVQLQDLEHSRKAVSSLQKMTNDVGRLILFIGYIQGPVENEKQKIDEVADRFSDTHKWLGLSKAEYPELKEVVDEFEDAKSQVLFIANRAKEVVSDPAIPRRKRLFYIGRVRLALALQAMQVATKSVEKLESKHLAEDPVLMRRIWISLIATIACGLVISLALCIMVIARLTRDMQQRLDRTKQNAECLRNNRDLLELREGTDEIAALDKSIHRAAAVLKELRKREFAMLDNAADVIFSLDSHLRFTACNIATQREWGGSTGTLVGSSVLELLTADTKEQVQNELGSMLVSAGEITGVEIESAVVDAQGKKQSYLWNVTWAPAKKSFFCAAQNITLLKSLQQFRRNFVSMVSHDLRSPLLAIGISLTLLQSGKRGQVSPKTLHQLGYAEDQLEHLKDLINGLLLWDKIQSGMATASIASMDSDEVCNEIVESLKNVARQVGVRLRQLVVPCKFKGDSKAISDVLSLLLRGLIRRAGAGSVITVYGDNDPSKVTFRAVLEVGQTSRATGASDTTARSSHAPQSSTMLQTVEMSIVEALLERQRGVLAKPLLVGDVLQNEFSFDLPREVIN